jgi:hypothetical protein
MKLKLYTELALLEMGYPVEILIPFIGTFNKEDEPGSVLYGRFDKFLQSGKDFLELSSLEACDVCLLPVVYESINHNEKNEGLTVFLKRVELANKPLFVFAGHDITITSIPYKNAIVFNSAILKSKNQSNIYSWPHFFEDLLLKWAGGKNIPREKEEKAVIGFCGYAPPLNITFGKEKLISSLKLFANYSGLIKSFPDKISHSYRARAIIGLKRSNQITLNLKLKGNFAFGPKGQLNTGNTKETNKDFRKNFVDNILESDYTLCVRGIGNNSVRFYETLCCGRIPVFVNTDSALPFDHVIDWKSLCVWVEEKDVDNVAAIVADFHNKITADEFTNLQLRLRTVWETYFSPEGFFKNLDSFII